MGGGSTGSRANPDAGCCALNSFLLSFQHGLTPPSQQQQLCNSTRNRFQRPIQLSNNCFLCNCSLWLAQVPNLVHCRVLRVQCWSNKRGGVGRRSEDGTQQPQQRLVYAHKDLHPRFDSEEQMLCQQAPLVTTVNLNRLQTCTQFSEIKHFF